MDTELVRVLDAVDKAGDINLMVFSDHGFAERLGGAADASSGLINVLDYINETDWEYVVGVPYTPHPTLQIWPKAGNEDWVSLIHYIQSGNFILILWLYFPVGIHVWRPV